MQVAAEIRLGTRTVLEYLLSPVQRAFHEAARERWSGRFALAATTGARLAWLKLSTIRGIAMATVNFSCEPEEVQTDQAFNRAFSGRTAARSIARLMRQAGRGARSRAAGARPPSAALLRLRARQRPRHTREACRAARHRSADL
ncbi:MAG: hypothetical protein RML56_01485 [Burkholderiales bacterium]|nr:hypothetical protein [Burkholderiales bacterium]